MIDAGCKVLYPMERLAVMGLLETLRRYRELRGVRRRLSKRFIDDPPDLFVGVDAPDFNLSLELALRRLARRVPLAPEVSQGWRGLRAPMVLRVAMET